MSEAIILVGKAITSISIAVAVAVIGYKTKEPVCLWALFFILILWC